ncbi:glycosyltransferase family A protein [Psychrobacter maritimus]|uniref:glycosyltransferase family 2 protein n=1 Tax=Psychrobacter maritimus TaxID=256325 RepID=UPI00248C18E2|nr:glycosyltransferase family A protein [Psychrobacter sp. WB2]WGV12258.1 glycosyltransferase family A protein [Psychrobacter sp. WB2]
MITILTPTYNRAHTLPKLYQSLIEQTNYSFEWLIIDDGSNDDTEALIKTYQVESNFSIRYYKKNNGGKCSAINTGVIHAHYEWIFIMDSDDSLLMKLWGE